MQQREFYPALFALMLLHHFPWSEEINVLGMILSYQEILYCLIKKLMFWA